MVGAEKSGVYSVRELRGLCTVRVITVLDGSSEGPFPGLRVIGRVSAQRHKYNGEASSEWKTSRRDEKRRNV